MHAAVLSAFLSAAVFTTAPDIIVPGQRSVPVESRFEAGPLLDHCYTQHVMQKGETLGAITKRHTGDVGDIGAILGLNPELGDGNRLLPGQRIWLPPRNKGSRKDNTFVYFAGAWPLSGADPFAPTDERGGNPHGSVTWFLVPKQHVQEFHALQKKGWTEVNAFLTKQKITTLSAAPSGRQVRKASPVRSRRDTYVITRTAKGVWHVRVERKAFDLQGKVVAPGAVGSADLDTAWLLLLAIAGAGALVWMRGKRQNTALPVTA